MRLSIVTTIALAPIWMGGPTHADDLLGRSAYDAFRDCDHCPELVLIPPGVFQMGVDADEVGVNRSETPRHEVTIDYTFAVGRYEVTRGEFARYVQATERQPGPCLGITVQGIHWEAEVDWRSPGFVQTDRDPVVCVSWDDAVGYMEWLSQETGFTYRLLSEAEWEYIAHAFALPENPCSHANIADRTYAEFAPDWPVHGCRDGHTFTAPVGSYVGNAIGVFDVLGNAWEWVADCWHDDYHGAPVDGSVWTSGDTWQHAGHCPKKVLRGGSWFSYPRITSATYRDWDLKHYRVSNYGFRVARGVSMEIALAGKD